MAEAKQDRTVHSFDGDGVLFWRIPFQKSALPIIGIRDKSSLYSPPDEIRFAHLGVIEADLHPSEYMSYLLHRVRGVFPKAAQAVFDVFADEDAVVLNTGRSNREPWVTLTEDSLDRAGIIGCFSNFYFRPEGFNSRDSKISRIAMLSGQYKKVRHYDDNPSDAVPMAAEFPDVEVVLLKDFSTRLLLSELTWDQFSNLHVANNLIEATAGVYIDDRFRR